MKRIILLFGLLVGISINSSSQYVYKYLYTITGDGVKQKDNHGDLYLSFNRNRSKCYEADKNGYKIQTGLELNFIKTKSNVHVYREKEIQLNKLYSPSMPSSIQEAYNQGYNLMKSMSANRWGFGGSVTFLFSTNFDRLNVQGLKGTVFVYKYVTQEEVDDIPDQLY